MHLHVLAPPAERGRAGRWGRRRFDFHVGILSFGFLQAALHSWAGLCHMPYAAVREGTQLVAVRQE